MTFRLTLFLTLVASVSFAQSNGGVSSNTGLVGFSDFLPTTRLFRQADPETEKRDYQVVKNIVDSIENEHLLRLYFVLTNEKKRVDEQASRYRHGHVFSNLDFIYGSGNQMVRRHQSLPISISEMDRALNRFSEIRSNLVLAGVGETEVQRTGFRLHRIAGLVNLMDTSLPSLRSARTHFETIYKELVNAKDVVSEQEWGDIYTFLVVTFEQLYQETWASNPSQSLVNLRGMVNYLWRYTEFKNKSNEKLMEAKLMELLRIYLPILDPDSKEFQELYKPYVEKLGKHYAVPGTSSSNTSSTNK